MKAIKLALWMAFTLAFLITAVSLIGNNSDPLSVKIFSYVSPTYPTWQILLACVFVGAALSAVFFIFELIVLETRNIRLRRLNQKLERSLGVAAMNASPTSNSMSGPQISSSSPAKGLSSPIEDSDV